MNFEALQGQMREQAALGAVVPLGDAVDRRDLAVSPLSSPSHYSTATTQRSTPTSSGSYTSSMNQFSPRLSAEASQQYLARLQHQQTVHQQANSLRERMEQEHDYLTAQPRHSSTGHLPSRRLNIHDAHSSSHPHLANLPLAVGMGGSRSVDTSPKLGGREYITNGGGSSFHDPLSSASPTNHRLSPSLSNRKRKYTNEGGELNPRQGSPLLHHGGSVESSPNASIPLVLSRGRSRSGGTGSSVSGGEDNDADSPPFGSPRGAAGAGGGQGSGGGGRRSRNDSGGDRMHLAGDRSGPFSARSAHGSVGGSADGASYEEILDSERKILEIERELKSLQAQQLELLQTRELRRYQLLQRKQDLQRSAEDQQGDDPTRSQNGMDEDRYRDSRRRLSNGQRSHGGGDTNSEVSGSVYGASSTMSVGFDDHPSGTQQERHSSLPMSINVGAHQQHPQDGHSGGLFSPPLPNSSSSAHHYRHDDPFASSTPSGVSSYTQYHPLSSPISTGGSAGGMDAGHNPSQSPEVPLNQLRISVLDPQQQQRDGSRRSNAYGNVKMEHSGGELTSPPPPSHLLSPPPPLFSSGLVLSDGTHSPRHADADSGSLFPISPFPFASNSTEQTGSPIIAGTMSSQSAGPVSSAILSPISPSVFVRRGSSGMGTGSTAMDTAFSCVNTPSGGQTMSAGIAAHGGLSGGWTEQFQSFHPSSSTGMTPIDPMFISGMSTQNSPQPPSASYVYTPLPSTH
jgi:hypothetical protein